jgi:hypothetical protein
MDADFLWVYSVNIDHSFIQIENMIVTRIDGHSFGRSISPAARVKKLFRDSSENQST